MKKILLAMVFLVGLSPLAIFAGALPTTLIASTPSLFPMLKRVMPAVVNLAAQGQTPLSSNPFVDKNNPAPTPDANNPRPGSKFQQVGSGVIVDARRGYILTNAH